MSTRELPPSAAALMPSLRGVGYSLESAVADTIDNSISAGASRVDLHAIWNDGRAAFAIVDNGTGMEESRLVEALRFGGGGPSTLRHAGDLGRFGLGMKTAALSQARRLTVASHHKGHTSVYRWDLDHIEKCGRGWELLEGFAPGSEKMIDLLPVETSGTLVLWEIVDFGRRQEIVTDTILRTEFRNLERHLGMVFHRFIQQKNLNLVLGNVRVEAWDPFLRSSDPPAEFIARERIKAPGGTIEVSGFVMPHRDRFMSETEFERAGGPDGWHAHQGFHIYRGNRLLVAGGWLRLGRGWKRSEASRLARLCIDIPTEADSEWQIDVKKSVARPPSSIRARLERLAEDVRKRAREVHLHRGGRRTAQTGKPRQSVWTADATGEAFKYRINREHPAVEELASTAGGDAVNRLLVLVENSVPIERIWLDRSENAPVRPDVDPGLLEIAVRLASALVNRGTDPEEAAAKIASAEPFDEVEGILEAIRKRLAKN